MPARFGTDGVRGVVNADIDAELFLALGRAAARVLGGPSFVVGRDTRRSGPLLQGAFSSGLASEGVDVTDVGVLPTPAVAWLAASRGLPGAVVSASHNPFSDNGIKIFAAGGLKLPTSTEAAIEDVLEELGVSTDGNSGPVGARIGQIVEDDEAASQYSGHFSAFLGGRDLEGLHVVLDCANGAASRVAPAVLAQVGARVDVIACQPDGVNINDGCGSTHPEVLAAEVVARGADVGIAFDGDADRLVAIDHTGGVASGDELLVLFASDLADRGELVGNAVVVTVMSNLGLRQAMRERGIRVVETPVGDRNVLEALEDGGLVLGGEQSGHIVFRHMATTGDGLLSALVLLDLVKRSGRQLAELVVGSMQRLPQLLVNVAVADPRAVVEATTVKEVLASVERSLADRGRVVLRASGTEPLVRVMVEATEESKAREAVGLLCDVVEKAGVITRAPTP